MEEKDTVNEGQHHTESCVTESPPADKFRRWGAQLVQMLKWTMGIFKRLFATLKNICVNIFKSDGDVGLLEDIKGAFNHLPIRRKGAGFVLAGLLSVGYFLSGVYTVKPGEVAVSRIFGKEVRQAVSEGLHYRLPWPFEAIEKVNVSEIRRVDVGGPVSKEPLLFPRNRSAAAPSVKSNVDPHAGHGGHGGASKPVESVQPAAGAARNQFFTGDENILEIKMNIQYQIQDASTYLFHANAPDALVSSSARTAVTEFLGRMRVDDLLTSAKSNIQMRIARNMQQLLDEYRTGLFIVSINLQEVNPPTEVAQAFRDVASAREEREEKINKAQGYSNTVIPEARGGAQQLISSAEGYREKVINQARGESEKFSAMLAEYRQAKDVTEHRLYLETMEMILGRAKKFIIDSKKENVNLKLVK